MLDVLRFTLLLGLAAWLGMLIFFTFFAAPSIFKVLPRELAGQVIGDIFSKYWMIGYVAGLLSLSSLLGIAFIEKSFPVALIILLTAMTGITFYSGLAVAPVARRLKAGIHSKPEPANKEALEKGFRRVHAKSAVLNLVVISSGVAALYLVSRSFRL